MSRFVMADAQIILKRRRRPIPMKQKKYTLESYLVTWQDYADFQIALRRMKTRRLERVGFRLLGMALILVSLLARVYFIYRSSYNSIVLFLLLCLGVGICLYYDYGMPYLVRRKACRYFTRKSIFTLWRKRIWGRPKPAPITPSPRFWEWRSVCCWWGKSRAYSSMLLWLL